jgi:hypothetical protein
LVVNRAGKAEHDKPARRLCAEVAEFVGIRRRVAVPHAKEPHSGRRERLNGEHAPRRGVDHQVMGRVALLIVITNRVNRGVGVAGVDGAGHAVASGLGGQCGFCILRPCAQFRARQCCNRIEMSVAVQS